MDFSPEERRQILESQRRASNQALLSVGHKLLVGGCLALIVIAILGYYSVDDHTIRIICLFFILAACTGLLLSKPVPMLKRLLKFRFRSDDEAEDLELDRLLGLAPEETSVPPATPARFSTGSQPGALGSPAARGLAAPVAEGLQPIGVAEISERRSMTPAAAPAALAESAPGNGHGAAVTAEAGIAADLPPRPPAFAAPAEEAMSSAAAVRVSPAGAKSGLLNWLLFGVICVGIVLAVVAAVILFSHSGAAPGR